jgi:hypothetical protein
MTANALADALGFVELHGIVLESARGTRPNLVSHIAQEDIRGNWWGHAKAQDIFPVLRSIRRSKAVLVCRLVDNKVTFVHRRLWPALARLRTILGSERIAAVSEVHTPQGKHVVRQTPFADWVPAEVLTEASRMTDAEAMLQLRDLVDPALLARS